MAYYCFELLAHEIVAFSGIKEVLKEVIAIMTFESELEIVHD